jgi:hypothetical protein
VNEKPQIADMVKSLGPAYIHNPVPFPDGKSRLSCQSVRVQRVIYRLEKASRKDVNERSAWIILGRAIEALEEIRDDLKAAGL